MIWISRYQSSALPIGHHTLPLERAGRNSRFHLAWGFFLPLCLTSNTDGFLLSSTPPSIASILFTRPHIKVACLIGDISSEAWLYRLDFHLERRISVLASSKGWSFWFSANWKREKSCRLARSPAGLGSVSEILRALAYHNADEVVRYCRDTRTSKNASVSRLRPHSRSRQKSSFERY